MKDANGAGVKRPRARPRARRTQEERSAATRTKVVLAATECVAELGFRLLGSFVLPESEWWDDYYTPLSARLDAARGARDDTDWTGAVAAYDEEIDVVREGLQAFGYVFYVMESA